MMSKRTRNYKYRWQCCLNCPSSPWRSPNKNQKVCKGSKHGQRTTLFNPDIKCVEFSQAIYNYTSETKIKSKQFTTREKSVLKQF